jgi:DNA-binding MarR family transcriptional regulator
MEERRDAGRVIMAEQEQDFSLPQQEAQNATANDDELLREVTEIEQHLRVIQRERYRVIEDDQRRGRLTPPQMQAMTALFQAGEGGGLTLKELSERMGLAHSTVSGIVDRLERRELVYRQVHPVDRRATRIVMTERVRAYIQQHLQTHVHGPLLDALRRANEAERDAILLGLSTLRRLLTEGTSRPESETT